MFRRASISPFKQKWLFYAYQWLQMTMSICIGAVFAVRSGFVIRACANVLQDKGDTWRRQVERGERFAWEGFCRQNVPSVPLGDYWFWWRCKPGVGGASRVGAYPTRSWEPRGTTPTTARGGVKWVPLGQVQGSALVPLDRGNPEARSLRTLVGISSC